MQSNVEHEGRSTCRSSPPPLGYCLFMSSSSTKVRSQKAASLYFRSLDLGNWRNFRRVDVELQRRVFLVGPNAAGKSNFLDVFRFLHDLVAIGGGFTAAVENRGGVSQLRSLSARRPPEVSIRVQVGTDDETHWEYELSFVQDKQRRPMVARERVVSRGEVLFSRPDEEDQADPERLTQTHLEQVNVNKRFRPLVEFFESVRYLHLVPQLVREPDRSVGKTNDPFGGDFLEQIARTQERTAKSRLRKIGNALRVAVPQLEALEFERDPDRGTPHLRGKYEHWRPQGAWQDESQFSDGTLRLLGLLWSILAGTGPLLLEEPELSLHPEIVRHLPQMFARIARRPGRQIFVSTHSPDILQDSGIGLNEVLLLMPQSEGTKIQPASAFDDVRALLEGGVDLAEAVIPKTRPRHADQLALFAE